MGLNSVLQRIISIYIPRSSVKQNSTRLYIFCTASQSWMKKMNVRKKLQSNSMFDFRYDEVISFAEEFGIHLLIEITLVGLIDSFLENTILSMFLGICFVEGIQLIWRKWRNSR